MKAKDEIGNKYGLLTVIEKSDKKIRNRIVWKCLCDCGNQIEVIGTDLRTGRKTDCGCIPFYSLKNEIGKVYGRLTVLEEAGRQNRKVIWKCRCECGNIKNVVGTDLRNGKVISCGCYNQEQRGQSVLINEIGNRYGKLVVIDKIRQDDKKTLWKCKCDCGNICYSDGPTLRTGAKKSCGCLKSIGESTILAYLEENKINYKKEYCFDDLVSENGGHPRFDFAILDNDNNLSFLIEFQGIQHFIDKGNFGKTQREITDNLKKEYCKKKNISIYYINYDENVKQKLEKIFPKKEIE